MATLKTVDDRALDRALKKREAQDALRNAQIRSSLKSNLDRVTELERIIEQMELDKKSLMADIVKLHLTNNELRDNNLALGGLAGASLTIKSAVLKWLEAVDNL